MVLFNQALLINQQKCPKHSYRCVLKTQIITSFMYCREDDQFRYKGVMWDSAKLLTLSHMTSLSPNWRVMDLTDGPLGR